MSFKVGGIDFLKIPSVYQHVKMDFMKANTVFLTTICVF